MDVISFWIFFLRSIPLHAVWPTQQEWAAFSPESVSFSDLIYSRIECWKSKLYTFAKWSKGSRLSWHDAWCRSCVFGRMPWHTSGRTRCSASHWTGFHDTQNWIYPACLPELLNHIPDPASSYASIRGLAGTRYLPSCRFFRQYR